MVYQLIHEKDNSITSSIYDMSLMECPTIEEICDIGGTDWVVGTPPDRMEKAMRALGIKYIEYINSPNPYKLLRDVLDAGNIAILRTITKGVPHWIIVKYCSPTLYMVLDPWLGELQYYQPQLDDIWKPRDYQFFEIILDENKKRNFTY